MQGEVKHYKPGDPGFDEIAKQITPIGQVRTGERHNKISSPIGLCRRKRYTENSEKI